jgi:hypothetical protein
MLRNAQDAGKRRSASRSLRKRRQQNNTFAALVSNCPSHLLAGLPSQPRNRDRAVGDSFNVSGALSR